jgi:NAD(P)H-dependent FMN reductase
MQAMITIISGTNRPQNETDKIARFIYQRIKDQSDEEVHFISLTDLPHDAINEQMYEENGQAEGIKDQQDQFILPSNKFWFVFPEYNGGFPGVLKLYLDALSVRLYKKSFKGKKACMTGVSSGRAGNLRGMEHLSGVLNHLGIVVMPNQLPISSIEKIVNVEGSIRDPETIQALEAQIQEFLAF